MRLFGITIPDEKRLDIGLTHLYGIGHSRAHDICSAAGLEPNMKSKDLTNEQEQAIREQIETYNLEGDLKREESANIKRLRDIRSYRGMRHQMRLPSRGQRTKTNSRTRRGNKRTTQQTGRRQAK